MDKRPDIIIYVGLFEDESTITRGEKYEVLEYTEHGAVIFDDYGNRCIVYRGSYVISNRIRVDARSWFDTIFESTDVARVKWDDDIKFYVASYDFGGNTYSRKFKAKNTAYNWVCESYLFKLNNAPPWIATIEAMRAYVETQGAIFGENSPITLGDLKELFTMFVKMNLSDKK